MIHVPPSLRLPAVQGLVRDLGEMAVNNNGVVPGSVYQSARSQFSSMARTYGDRPEARRALDQMAAAMDDAMERGLRATNSPDAGAFGEARREWRNALVIEKALGSGDHAHDIEPNKLRNALGQQNKRDYQRGRGDFAEVTTAADEMLARLPQSGTGPRMAMGTIGAAVGGLAGHGDPSATVGGALAPGLIGRGLMSPWVQRYLKNQAATPYNIPGGPWGAARGAIGALSPGGSDPLGTGAGP